MMQDIQEYLLSKGIHPSLQRIAIMNYLLHNRTHPTVEEIYNVLNPAMPTLSKTTIYNTLKLFSDKGAIQTLNIDEKNARFDADTSAHSHFMCTKCGEIFDIESNISTSDLISNPDFIINETHIYLKGCCPNCKQLNNH